MSRADVQVLEGTGEKLMVLTRNGPRGRVRRRVALPEGEG